MALKFWNSLISGIFYLQTQILNKNQMNKQARKQAVLSVANQLCSVENRVTTKEIKLNLHQLYPGQFWTTYNYSGIDGVSDLFHELVREGHFVSVADNGTFQTYASTKMPMPTDTRSMPVIHGESVPPRLMATMVTMVGQGNKVTKQPKTVNQTVAKVAPKKTAMKKTAMKKTATGQPRLANGRFAPKPKAPAPSLMTRVKNLVKPNPMHNVKRISRTAALKMIQGNKGRFFTAVFTKKDGTLRTINAQYLPDQDNSALGYVKVRDQALIKKQPNDCTRQINLQTLSQIKIGGTLYKVK